MIQLRLVTFHNLHTSTFGEGLKELGVGFPANSLFAQITGDE